MPKNRVVSHGLQELASKLERVASEPEMRQLLCLLPEAMASEVAAAPVRTRPYALGPRVRRPAGDGDAAWLRTLWNQHGPGQAAPFLRTFCSNLLGLQVMLGDTDQTDAYEIDLVGVSATERLPVVIELQSDAAGQSSIDALLAATARALALKKAWPHRLRADWLQALRPLASASRGYRCFSIGCRLWWRRLPPSGPWPPSPARLHAACQTRRQGDAASENCSQRSVGTASGSGSWGSRSSRADVAGRSRSRPWFQGAPAA